MKNKSFRLSDKTYNKIENIRKQLLNKGFQEEQLTDSFIIREAINVLNEKAKYFIWER